MAALARIMPKIASAHSISALANEDAPPIEADKHGGKGRLEHAQCSQSADQSGGKCSQVH